MIVLGHRNAVWPLAYALSLNQCAALAYNVNLVFDSRIMVCYHVFVQMTLYHLDIQQFARFRQNLNNDPKDKNNLGIILASNTILLSDHPLLH